MAKAEFGVRLPAGGPLASAANIEIVARRAEQLGYDCLWVHDFISWTTTQDRYHISCGSIEAVEAAGDAAPPLFYESLTNLAFLAGVTRSVRLGVAVLILPWRNPIVAAKQVATIDNLSGGRLICGIGVGGPRSANSHDFEVLQVDRRTKYEVTKDYFKAMRTLWTDERPSWEGEYISFIETEMNPKPVQKPYPPIWMGGGGPRSMDIAAEFCSGWLPPWIAPEHYPAKIEELRAMARNKGRGEVAFTIATEVYAHIAPSGEEARRFASRTLAVLPAGFAKDATDDSVSASALVGSPAEITDRLATYVANGVQHFELKFIYRTIPHLLEQLEMFGEAVMPHFRGDLGRP